MKKRKAAILIWLYHVELWDEFLQLLQPLDKYINLYIGLCTDNNNDDVLNSANKCFSRVRFQYFSNAGVDVRPFLFQLNLLNKDEEPVFLKLHSKKSYFGIKKHINWRVLLLNSLVGSRGIFLNNYLNLLGKNNIGAICNEQLLLDKQEFSNYAKIQDLCKLLSIDYTKLNDLSFCGGNMFASRTALFQKYFHKETIEVLDKYLLQEPGKVSDSAYNGTYSHSLERIFGYIPEHEGKKLIGSQVVTYDILNDELPDKKAHLVIAYDKSCYLTENPNVYGQVINQNSKSVWIQWLHLQQAVNQEYKFVSDKTLQKVITN